MTTILKLPVSNSGAYVRAGLLGVLFLILMIGTLVVALVSVVASLPFWLVPLLVASAVIVGIPLFRTLPTLGGTFELFADDDGNQGARLLSRSGRERLRFDPPLEYVFGVARMDRDHDLVICFAHGGGYPVAIHGSGGDEHQERAARWGTLDGAVWSRVGSWYSCKQFSEFARALDDGRSA